jgi:hypothetical protein
MVFETVTINRSEMNPYQRRGAARIVVLSTFKKLVRSMVFRLFLADRIRFVVGLVGLFAVLMAFRLPMGPPAEFARRPRFVLALFLSV